MIRASNLVFDYGAKRALNHVNLDLPKGSITALVGPNGAGKTTLMRCLAALANPVGGIIELDGRNIHENPREAHRKIGYLPDFFGLYDTLSVGQCLEYRAQAQGIPRTRSLEAAQKAAARVGLSDRMGEKAGHLSRGLRQRLAVGQAIVHEPILALLDEPASGLDPEARISLSNLLKELQASGMTLLVSSHILAELEDYSTHLLIVRDGRVVEFTAIGESAKHRALILLELSKEWTELAELLTTLPDVRLIEAKPTAYRIETTPDPKARADLLRQLVEAGAPVASFSLERTSLQDAYIAKSRISS